MKLRVLRIFLACFFGISGCNSQTPSASVTNIYNTYIQGGTESTPTPTLVTEYPSKLPACTQVVPLADLPVDSLFDLDGILFYIEVSPAQREAQDMRMCYEGQDFGGENVYDLEPEQEEENPICPSFATNIRVVLPTRDGCADTGKVGLNLVGQSSFRTWEEGPNFSIDANDFREELEFPGGYKLIRLNNGQASSTVVREPTALAIWQAMGYPAPETRFVKVTSNYWDWLYPCTEDGECPWTAQVMVEPYKKPFFKEQMPDVVHVWEGVGDPFMSMDVGGFAYLECQWSANNNECDQDAFEHVVDVVAAAPNGDGFMVNTAEVIDWELLHRNQCLSAITGTGDDWIHNSNNLVIALRDDGKIVFLPYSTDISAEHPWYSYTPFDGMAYLTSACAADPECRIQSLDTCLQMVDEFEELMAPQTIVEERCEVLEETSLMREPDESACEDIYDFYDERPAELREELLELKAFAEQPVEEWTPSPSPSEPSSPAETASPSPSETTTPTP